MDKLSWMNAIANKPNSKEQLIIHMMNKDNQTSANTSLPDNREQEPEIISGSEVLIRSLIAEGVDTLFGYPGGAIMPVFDALYDHKHEIRHILVRHEQGAVHAAQGYARVSEKVGVALVTSGPGATNTITGITDAMMDSTPIVVISGQVISSLLGSDAFQEADVIGVTQPITKWAYQIRRAEDISWAVSRAFYIAASGRPGPVVLDFAKDAQVNKCAYSYRKTTFLRSYQPVPEVEDDAVRMPPTLSTVPKSRWRWWDRVCFSEKPKMSCVLFWRKPTFPLPLPSWGCRPCLPITG